MKTIELLSRCKATWIFKCYDEKYLDQVIFNVILDGEKMKCLDNFYRELEGACWLTRWKLPGRIKRMAEAYFASLLNVQSRA